MIGVRKALAARASRTTLVCSLVALAAAALPTSAAAALPTSTSGSVWRQVTASGGSDTDEVATLRLGNVLHVGWSSGANGPSAGVHDTRISATGKILGDTPIASGWIGTENPALVMTPGGGLNAIWGGQHTLNVNDPNQEMNSATSSDGGSTWSLTPADVVGPTGAAYQSATAAATEVGTAETPIMTWYGTSGVWVHAGLSSSTQNYNFQPFGCCGYYSNIAVDGAGYIKLIWFSNATGHLGVWTQSVGGDGSPMGSPQQVPGTSGMSDISSQRIGLVTRPSGGFYTVLPISSATRTKVVLWQLGNAGTRTIANLNTDLAFASIAVDATGRLWVFWERSVNYHPKVFATRSNKTATRFGAVVSAGAPRRAGSIYNVDGNASNQALDVFANTAIGSSSTSATWFAHVYPGLTLNAKPGKLVNGRRAAVRFTVTDAGAPVKGARVRVGRMSGKTNRHGRVTLGLILKHTTQAIATHKHYTKAVRKLRVRG